MSTNWREESSEFERLLDEELFAQLKRMDDFAEKRWLACPHCGKEAERLEQVGRCVYVRPCGCRLWQGKVPKAWREIEAR